MTAGSAAVLPAAAYEELRRRILAGEETPGSTLTEAAVAARFGIARQTARQAIDRLVNDRLLDRSANRAARVPELTSADIHDIYEGRAVVERAAIERLARSGPIPADALEAHRELLAIGDTAPFAAIDARFHRALVAGQPNTRLSRMHALLMGEIELCIAQVENEGVLTIPEIGAQHQAILDAVVAGDAESAGRLTLEHILGARDRLLAAYHLTHAG